MAGRGGGGPGGGGGGGSTAASATSSDVELSDDALYRQEADPGETTNLLPPHNVSGQPPRASGEAASRHEATAARMAQRADQILTSGELGGRKRMQALRTM